MAKNRLPAILILAHSPGFRLSRSWLDVDREDQRRAAAFVEPADAFLNQGEVQPDGAGLGRGFDREVVGDGFARGKVARQICC